MRIPTTTLVKMRIPTTTLLLSAFLIFCCLGVVLAGKPGPSKRRRVDQQHPAAAVATLGAGLASAGGALGAALAQASTTGAAWAPAVWAPGAAGNFPGTTALAAGATALAAGAAVIAASSAKGKPAKEKRRNVRGAKFMIYRTKDGQPCEGDDPKRIMDSIVYRYGRLVGFLESAKEADKDDRIEEAQAFHRTKEKTANKSHLQIAEKFAMFERFCKAMHPGHPYTIYLMKVEAATLTSEKVEYQSPSSGLIEAYIFDIRGEGPEKGGLRGGTVKAYVGAISAAHTQFGFGLESPTDHPTIRKLIKKYQEEDGTDSTASFNFLTDLPTIHGACWSMRGWADRQRLMCWSMFLVAICLMARASEMTDFCPTYEDITLPAVTAKAAWDKDGFPKWIGIALR